jgi:hypothetical protein
MAAQTVTIKLTLPYALRPEELAAIKPRTAEAFCREISEGFIGRALVSQYGQELDQKTARLWSSIKRELDRMDDELLLNGVQWEWLSGLFFGAKAEEVKIPPAHAVWWFQWLEALEDVRAQAKAGAP